MTQEDFWYIIEKSKKQTEGDVEAQCDNLLNILVALEEEKIADFEMIVSELLSLSYTPKLWAAGYIINGGCSDDGFVYFRCWLISKGKKVFYLALEDPEKLTRFVATDLFGEVENEELLYVATKAFTLKTGKEMEDFDSLLSPSTPLSEIGFEWEEDNLDTYLPKLWKKFKGMYN